MADVYSNKVGNNWCPQIHLVVSLAAGTDAYDDLNWYADYVAHGYAAYTNGKARSWSIDIDGQVRSGSLNINGHTGTVRLGSGTIRVNKQYSARNIGVSCSMNMDFTWNGAYLGTASGSGSHPIDQKTSYTVSYNANGGSGAPGNQTKWYGENLALSGTKPTRAGHNFAGWATSASGAVAYQPGATYSANAGVTLYAKWTPHTYAVTYNANGGSGAPGNQTKTYGVNLTLSSTKPTRTNYNFKGWGTSASSTTAAYQPGGTYSINAALALYAIWELAWLEPRITNLQAARCNSAGTLSEEGTYAKVTFNWATDRTISSIKIVCNGVTTNASGSGTSGAVSVVVGANALNVEKSYSVDVTVTDAVGGVTISTVVAPMNYIMDIAPNGSVAFGKPANPSSKKVEFAKPVYSSLCSGLSGNSTPSTAPSNGYKLLAKSRQTNSNQGLFFTVRVTGHIGGHTANTQGYIDVIVPLRNASPTTITINASSPKTIGAPASLIALLAADDYIYFYIYRRGGDYHYYNLQFYGEGLDIVDSAWSGSRLSGTLLYDSNVLKTDNFGGYPAKYEYSVSGYPGLALPDRTRTEYIRTTYNGLIPYQSGGASTLGTESWPFNSVYTKNLNWTGNGLKGRVMKQIWSGNWSSGSITVPELPYYNMFLVKSAEWATILCSRNDTATRITGSGGAYVGSAFVYTFVCEFSGTTLSNPYWSSVPLNNGGYQISGTIKTIYGIL